MVVADRSSCGLKVFFCQKYEREVTINILEVGLHDAYKCHCIGLYLSEKEAPGVEGYHDKEAKKGGIMDVEECSAVSRYIHFGRKSSTIVVSF